MIGARFGHFLDKPLKPLIEKIKVSPNTLTITGFVIIALASAVLTKNLLAGGVIMVIGGIFDMLDGMVARVRGISTPFGAFLDSFLDRVADALLFMAVAWYMAGAGDHVSAFVSLAAMVGAFLVSYARARAEGLGHECKVGLMERPERGILLAAGAISGLMAPALLVICVLTWFTVAQRVFHVKRSMGGKG